MDLICQGYGSAAGVSPVLLEGYEVGIADGPDYTDPVLIARETYLTRCRVRSKLVRENVKYV